MKKIFKKILNGFKKIISVIKKKWLVKTTTTVLLMAIFIAIFILITTGMKSLNLNPIDITSGGVNSLTQETKNKLKDIGIEESNYQYIVCYKTGEVMNITVKKTSNGELLYASFE